MGSDTPYVDWVTLGGTVAAGDALVFASGECTIALSNSGQIHGVAAEAGVDGDEIMFYPAVPTNIFEAQCSGTYATASHLGVAVDLEGTTGIQEVNEDSTTEKVVKIMELKSGSEVGANARVYVTFPRSSYTDLEDAEA
jgi:hypothetical protein